MRSFSGKKHLKDMVYTLAVFALLFAWSDSARAHNSAQIVTNHFDMKEFERFSSGYHFTIENKSKNAFTDFLIIIYGLDINDVTVYQHEICVEFMKGRSEKTYFLEGYQKDIFRTRIKVVDWLYGSGCSEYE